MITNELLAFVTTELSKETTEEEIRKALMEGGGWNELDVKEAFDALGSSRLFEELWIGEETVQSSAHQDTDRHTYQDTAKVEEAVLASLSAKLEDAKATYIPKAPDRVPHQQEI